MAQKGEAGKAFSFAIVSSFFGGLLSIIVLIMIAPPLGKIALQFGPYEYFAIVIFSLTLIASLSGDSLPKGIMAGLIGIGFAMVGSAPIDAFPDLHLDLVHLMPDLTCCRFLLDYLQFLRSC